MTSLGETLRVAREEKGLSIETIARDTNIARRYLTALETEDFAQFPAESYALGFLKNYGEYLGLDTASLLSMFKIIKIQEQPTPMNELLTKSSGNTKTLPLVIILLIALGGAGTGIFFFLHRGQSPAKTEASVHAIADYTLENGILEQRFYSGDSVRALVGGEEYKLTLANLGEAVTIDSPKGPIILDLSQTVAVDINDDGTNEIEISLEDYARNEPLMGAWIRFHLQDSGAAPPVIAEAATVAVTPAAPPAGYRTVFTSTNPYPFTLQAQFQGFCMFRWEILREAGRQTRNEQYCSRGSELSIQAQNGIRLWVSNAAFVKLQAIGGGRTQDVEIGGPGEVVVVDVAWIRDEAGGWRLAVARLET
jgi:cytoskeletal protein RodZ